MPRPPRSLLVGIGALTLLRFLIAATVPLGDDETFYWEWSRHLAPAYIDHPPAIAFLVWAATRLLGSTPFAVHSVSVVLSFFTSLAVWSLAREVLGRDRAATWAVVLFSAVPVFAAGALLAAPDAPLGLAWVLTLLWAWRAATRDAPRGWLWAGLFLGAALDSKYTAAALPLSVGCGSSSLRGCVAGFSGPSPTWASPWRGRGPPRWGCGAPAPGGCPSPSTSWGGRAGTRGGASRPSCASSSS